MQPTSRLPVTNCEIDNMSFGVPDSTRQGARPKTSFSKKNQCKRESKIGRKSIKDISPELHVHSDKVSGLKKSGGSMKGKWQLISSRGLDQARNAVEPDYWNVDLPFPYCLSSYRPIIVVGGCDGQPRQEIMLNRLLAYEEISLLPTEIVVQASDRVSTSMEPLPMSTHSEQKTLKKIGAGKSTDQLGKLDKGNKICQDSHITDSSQC